MTRAPTNTEFASPSTGGSDGPVARRPPLGRQRASGHTTGVPWPLQSRRRERVRGHVARVTVNGPWPLFRGGPHPFGELCCEPTMLADVKPTHEIFQEAVFGPLLTWSVFDAAPALAPAYATRCGLAAMVYACEQARVERAVDNPVAGAVRVNCFFIRDLAAQFVGAGIADVGREGGGSRCDFFCDVKNAVIRRRSFEGLPRG